MPTLFDAVKLLSEAPLTIENLSAARTIVATNRILPVDIDLAILAIKNGNMDKAKNHINGPSGRGSGLGAIKDLQKILEAK
jgi:hypothetical protein